MMQPACACALLSDEVRRFRLCHAIFCNFLFARDPLAIASKPSDKPTSRYKSRNAAVNDGSSSDFGPIRHKSASLCTLNSSYGLFSPTEAPLPARFHRDQFGELVTASSPCFPRSFQQGKFTYDVPYRLPGPIDANADIAEFLCRRRAHPGAKLDVVIGLLAL